MLQPYNDINNYDNTNANCDNSDHANYNTDTYI